MFSKRVYVDHLRNVELFEQFTRKDLEKVAAAGVHMTLPDGKRLIEQGASGYDAYVLLRGTVQVRRNGRLMTTVGAGALIGELALLDQGERTATATCVGECDVLVLSRGTFLAIVDEMPVLAHKLLASLASKVRELDKRASI